MTDRDLHATCDQAGGREQLSGAGEMAPASKGDGLDEALGPDGARWAIRAADGTSHVVCWYATGELYAGQPGRGMRQAGNCPDLETARRQVLAIQSRLNGGEHG
jgi:hypothetical protein